MTTRQIKLPAANGVTVFPLPPNGQIGAQRLDILWETYPTAGSALVEYQALGSSSWATVAGASALDMTSARTVSLSADVRQYRITLSGMTGGLNGLFVVDDTGVGFGSANGLPLTPVGEPPALSGPGAGAVSGLVGGLSNGSPANGLPGGFKSQSFMTPGQTLQAAIDAAPASNTLVTVVTTGIAAFGVVYTVPATAKPGAFFIDAMNAREMDGAFIGTTFNDPEGLLSKAFVWKYDAANSRVICYNQGNAVTQAALVNYHAVVATTQASYDSIVLRPGIAVLGMGFGVSEIRNYTGRVFPQTDGSPSEFSVIPAAYSAVIGMDIVRNVKSTTPPIGFSAIYYPTNVNADCFFVMDSHVYLEAGVVDTPGGGYCVAICFASTAASGGRAKNTQFVRCLIESYGGRDAYETRTGLFNGMFIFRDCQIHGGAYVDGLTCTAILINTPYTNLAGINRDRAILSASTSGVPYAISMGCNNPFPGYTEQYIAVNSPHYVAVTEDVLVTKMYLVGMINNSTAKVRFENSPVSAYGVLTRSTAVAVTSTQANAIKAKGSLIPPVELTVTGTTSSGFSVTTPTPLNPKTFTQQTYATQTTTAKPFGILTISLEDLQDRTEVRAYARGKMAANANTKTLQVQTGANAVISPAMTLVNVSGAVQTGVLNGSSWDYSVTARISGSTALIEGTIRVGATAVSFLTEQALTAGQYVQVVLLATGVATNDITANYQATEVQG